MDQLPELQNEDISGFFDQIDENPMGMNGVGRDANLSSLWLNTSFVDGFNKFRQNCQEEHFSDTESLGSAVSAVPSPAIFADTEASVQFSFIPDDELKQLSVKELNTKLKGQPKDVVRSIKKHRRTLKNRGYAHSCRIRRIEEKSCLLERKTEMEVRIADLQRQLDDATAERDLYKKRYEALVHLLMKHQSIRQ